MPTVHVFKAAASEPDKPVQPSAPRPPDKPQPPVKPARPRPQPRPPGACPACGMG